MIHGKVVKEENKKPLPGASIIIKGTSIGTVSDSEGNFTLTNPNPEVDKKTGGLITEFVISYVGYQTVSERFGPILGQPDKEGVTTSYDFPLKEGVIVIDLPDYKNVPPPPPPPPAMNDDGEELFIVVEDLPKYPGGMQGLAMHIQEQKKKLASTVNLNGKAKIAFTVNEMGKITNIKRVTSDNDLVGKAGVVIVEHLADWTPGKQRGKPVPVNYILPVEF